MEKSINTPLGRFYAANETAITELCEDSIHDLNGNLCAILHGYLYLDLLHNREAWELLGISNTDVQKVLDSAFFYNARLVLNSGDGYNLGRINGTDVTLQYVVATKDGRVFFEVFAEELDSNGCGTGDGEYYYTFVGSHRDLEESEDQEDD